MELPDFMKYSGRFSKGEFAEKISRIAKRAGAKLVYAALVLYYTLQSPQVSVKDKAIIIGALGYLISPLDVVPDAIPIAGLGDDLAVLLYVLQKVWVDVSDDVKEPKAGCQSGSTMTRYSRLTGFLTRMVCKLRLVRRIKKAAVVSRYNGCLCLLCLDFLFHVKELLFAIIKLILQKAHLLRGNHMHTQSVFHLPFPFQGENALIDVCGNIRVDM